MNEARSLAGQARDQVRAMGWRPVLADGQRSPEDIETSGADIVLVELPAEGWRSRLSAVRRLLARRPRLRALLLSRTYPAGYTQQALDGAEAIPLVRLPCPGPVLRQALSAAG